jgi:hypothetical protein
LGLAELDKTGLQAVTGGAIIRLIKLFSLVYLSHSLITYWPHPGLHLSRPAIWVQIGGMPDTAPESPNGRPRVAPVKDPQRSRITNGSAFLPGTDGRSAWIRRAKDVLAAHLSDVPDASAAERSIIRRAAVLTTELERLEVRFATAGEANADDLDLYQRTANSLRRLLEAVGLQRRTRDVTPDLADYLKHVDGGTE